MGGVWCKADKGQTRSYSSKGPFNSAISRWTDHMRQAYRKPKTQRPRPPQKPLRNHNRPTISNPQLVKEQSSDGWRTATLLVPEPAPVPPPRKKRKRNQDITRAAYSMDDLNRIEPLNISTISLPDKYRSETHMGSRSSSSTLVVTPVLESRLDHPIEEVCDNQEDNKENVKVSIEPKIEEEDEEETESAFIADEIIPIEKETLFSSRTILQSNLGYIDKLSAISEVSTESGFDDKTDVAKSSQTESDSVTSSESVPRESGLNILAHIQNINNVSHLNERNRDIREKTAISKKEWLQNILKEEPDPYFISRDTLKDFRRASDGLTLEVKGVDVSGKPNSLPADHLHLMNRETETSVVDNSANKTPPSTPDHRTIPNSIYDTAGNNHSVLLELLQENTIPEDKSVTSNPFVHKEETIFLTNTKTNIIYKSLSSDKLTDDYDINYEGIRDTNTSQFNTRLNEEVILDPAKRNCSVESTNSVNNSTSKSHLSDYSFKTPKLVESDVGLNSFLEDNKSKVVTSFDLKEIKPSHNYVKAMENLQLSTGNKEENNPSIIVNGVDPVDTDFPSVQIKLDQDSSKDKNDAKLNVNEPLTIKDSVSSSRRSSITDSLHEFEISIYDMLKESKKNRESSDEDDSLKIIKTESRQ